MEKLIKEIGQIADRAGIEAFVVGGYVRDKLLHRQVKDFDVMVLGDGIAFAEKVAEHFKIKTLVVYHNFGTAMLPLGESHDFRKIEFVGARRESYHTDSRNPSVEPADLQSDLSRRDFTVNAMAMQINENHYGEITDLFGGKEDLENKILKTPLDPDETFSDDPLRMMRAIRFAAQLQFTIEEITLCGIKKNAHRIEIISQERITDEFLKILASAKPSVGLQLLNDTGLLKYMLPELTDLNGVEQQQGFLHKDVFKHTLKVVDNIAEMTEDIRLRFAALFHDIGKPRTKKFVEGIGWTFYGHEEVGSRMVKGIGKKMKLPNDFYLYVSKIVKLHMRPIQLVDEDVTDSAIRRLIFDGGEDIDELLTLCRADITSGNKERAKKHLANFEHVLNRVREVEEKDRLRAFQPPIRGEEIMTLFNLQPGKKVGALKKMIEEAILDGIIPNEYQAAYNYLMQNKDKILDSNSATSAKELGTCD